MTAKADKVCLMHVTLGFKRTNFSNYCETDHNCAKRKGRKTDIFFDNDNIIPGQ